MAGFPFGPQPIWSRLHTVELASYRLRKDSMKYPPPAVIESFPRGLLVPNSRIWISDRPMRVFAIFPRLCNEKPRISENFRFFHAIFKVHILPFRSILKVQFTLQPGRLQHPPGHALPFGQTFGSMPIFSVKSPRDLSYCARLIAPCSRNVSNNSFCRR